MKRLGLVLMLMFAVGALAFSARTAQAYGFQTGHTVTVPSNGSVSGTYYAAGQVVDISGTVNGDLICVGDTVTVSGPVHGDVICAGQNVSITGPVDGSVRVAGQNVTIDGTVGRNVTIAAQSFDLGGSAFVAGDLGLLTQSADIGGSIAKTLYGTAQTISIDNTVGPVSIMTTNLSLGETAHVNGNLHYTSSNAIAIDHAKVSGGVIHSTSVKQYHASWPRFLLAFWLWWLLGALVVGLALVLVAPGTVRRIGATMRDRPLPSIGWGVLVSILAPIAALVLMLTVIGIPLALFILVIWLLLLGLSTILAGITVGAWIIERYKWSRSVLIWGTVLGIPVTIIVFSVPLLGMLVSLSGVVVGGWRNQSELAPSASLALTFEKIQPLLLI